MVATTAPTSARIATPGQRRFAHLAPLTLNRVRLGLAVAATLFAMPCLSQSELLPQVTAAIAREMKLQFGTTEQLNAALAKSYGVRLAPEKLIVGRASLKALMLNEAMPAYIAAKVLPIYRPDMPKSQLASAMQELIVQMQVQGLARLSSNQQAAFLTHLASTMKAMGPGPCRSMLVGQMSTVESARIERAYIGGLPLAQFERINSLYQAAVEAELAQYPDVRTINRDQAKLAESVYENATMKRLRRVMSSEALQRVASGYESAPASEACTVAAESLLAALDMPEPYRSWKLTRFIQSIQ